VVWTGLVGEDTMEEVEPKGKSVLREKGWRSEASRALGLVFEVSCESLKSLYVADKSRRAPIPAQPSPFIPDPITALPASRPPCRSPKPSGSPSQVVAVENGSFS